MLGAGRLQIENCEMKMQIDDMAAQDVPLLADSQDVPQKPPFGNNPWQITSIALPVNGASGPRSWPSGR